MPLFFGIVGIFLIICALNNTLSDASDLLRKDFTGQNNFLVWIVAIVIVGAAGYIPRFKPVSYAFLALIFLSIILANQKRDGSSGGLFAQFFGAINSAGTSGGSSASSGDGSGFSSVFGNAASRIKSFSEFSSLFSTGNNDSLDASTVSI